jgi:hypothetical protein
MGGGGGAEVLLYYNVNSQEMPISAFDTSPYRILEIKLGTFHVDFSKVFFSHLAENKKQENSLHLFSIFSNIIQQISTRKLVFFYTQNMISQLLIIFAEVRILLPHTVHTSILYTISSEHTGFYCRVYHISCCTYSRSSLW